jgi:hypothetical protein
VTEFDFADTLSNRIEKRRAELDDPLSATQYDAALDGSGPAEQTSGAARARSPRSSTGAR